MDVPRLLTRERTIGTTPLLQQMNNRPKMGWSGMNDNHVLRGE